MFGCSFTIFFARYIFPLNHNILRPLSSPVGIVDSISLPVEVNNSTIGLYLPTTEQSGKLLECNSCKLRQRVTPESKHWFVRVFAHDTNTNTNFYLNVFHQQLVNLFKTKNKYLHPALTEEDLEDILTGIDGLKITYNLADGKLLHVN